eukprot:g39335.t1
MSAWLHEGKFFEEVSRRIDKWKAVDLKYFGFQKAFDKDPPTSRGTVGDRDGQHYPDGRHGGPERHNRDSGSQREGWGGSAGGYGPDMKRVGDNRGGIMPRQS